MWWKIIIAPGIVYFVAGALWAPIAAFLIALYVGYQYAAHVVKGRPLLGGPPPEKTVIIGVYVATVLFGEMFFLLGRWCVLFAKHWT